MFIKCHTYLQIQKKPFGSESMIYFSMSNHMRFFCQVVTNTECISAAKLTPLIKGVNFTHT